MRNFFRAKAMGKPDMRSGFIAIFIVCCLALNTFNADAQTTRQDRGIGIYLDQDLFVPVFNEDRDYTMGMAFEFFWEKEKGLYPLDNVVREVSEWLGMSDSDKNLVYSFMLGSIAYTPDNLADPNPIYNDRPYSSLIYLSNKRVRANDTRALAAEVLVGVLGTGVAEAIQTGLHRWYRSVTGGDTPVDPKGWSHQISAGGELTFRIRLSNSLLHPTLSSEGNWDVATTWGGSLGYQTNLEAGFAIRAGNIKSPFWSLPYDPINRGNFIPSAARNEWYFWAAARTHLVIYDALLQGQFRHSDVTFSSDQIERFIYDGALGLTLGYHGSQLTLAANVKSPEFKLTDRHQVWGSIYYVYHF